MKKNKPFSVTTVVVSAQSSTAHIFIATIIYIIKFYNTYIQFRKKNIICHSVHIITSSNDHLVPFLNILPFNWLLARVFVRGHGQEEYIETLEGHIGTLDDNIDYV